MYELTRADSEGLRSWLGEMKAFAVAAKGRANPMLRSAGMRMLEVIYEIEFLIARLEATGKSEPQLPLLAERLRSERLEALAIEQDNELGTQHHQRVKGGAKTGDKKKARGDETRKRVGELAIRYRKEGTPEHNLRSKIAAKLGITPAQVRNILPTERGKARKAKAS